MKILIVEDEKLLSKSLIFKLEKEGFSIIQAKDGKDGLKKALKNHPDLIILDIIMPKMDGFVMFQKLREDKWGKKVPVIILSNLQSPLKIAEIKDDENFIYLTKADVHLENLISLIRGSFAMHEADPSLKMGNIMQKVKTKMRVE